MQKLIFIHFALFMVLPGFSANFPKHWHESKGFGAGTKGGIAGGVYKVTNLKASGAGSLKDAAGGSNRLVVFEVGGVIEGGLSIGGSNVTIAGQTAPSPGITLIRGNLSANGNNIVVSHITVQLGDGVGGYPDASNIQGDNVVFDHVSVYWGKDETLSLHGVNNVTLFKCIIAEGLQYTGHEDGEHSKGSLINKGCQKLSLIGNLYAHNALRNPRSDGGEIFIANDVVYNWAPGWDHQGPKWSRENPEPTPEAFNVVVSARSGCNVAMVGSVGLQGPESVGEFFLDGHNGTANGYVKDNIIKDQQGKDLTVVNTENIKVLDSPPLWPEGMEPLPAHEALYNVLRTVGPRPGDRNFHNARVVKTVADGDGEVIDSQDEVGGYPKPKETKHSLSVPDGAQARQKWLDSLEDEIAVDKEIDLSRLYKLVGSNASDKFAPPTPVIKPKLNHNADVSGIQIVQRHLEYKQLHLTFKLPAADTAGMTLYGLTGDAAAHLPPAHFKAGQNEMAVNVQSLSAGLYVCSLRIGATNHNRIVNIY